METKATIVVQRQPDEDASAAASRAAREAGTKVSGSLRWYGNLAPGYREVGTDDGRMIRVNEPS